MATLNMDSILNKAKHFVNNTTEGQKRVDAIVDKKMLLGGSGSSQGNTVTIIGAAGAADKFIEVLRAEIQSHAGTNFGAGNLGATAITALSQLSHGEPRKVGKNMYQIDISFTGNLSRDSLNVDDYDGIENIAALLNNGYSARNRTYGYWLNHSHYSIPSLQNRTGAQFIQGAIRNFMSGYAAECGVVDITCDGIYETRNS